MEFSSQMTMYESCVALHEVFLSYIEAGFSEDQSLKLIAYIVRPEKEEK